MRKKYYWSGIQDNFKRLNLYYQKDITSRLSTIFDYEINFFDGWNYDGDHTNWNLNLNYSYNPDDNLKSVVNLSYLKDNEYSLKYLLTKNFDIPLPWVKTKGVVEGKIFYDANTNTYPETKEKKFNGVQLSLGQYKIISDTDGKYKFPPLKPGKYKMEINTKTIPAGYKTKIEFPQVITIKRGQIKKFNVPLLKATTISGKVLEEVYKNAQFTGEKRVKPEVKVLLYRDGKKIDSTFTQKDGCYVFENLVPGTYKVEPSREWLADELELQNRAENIKLNSGERKTDIDLILKQKEKEIIKTYTNGHN